MTHEESSVPAHPSTEDQDHPHACTDGVVYVGHVVHDEETGEEVEVAARIACRRCNDHVVGETS